MNDKPTPPDGYELMLGKDVPNPMPIGTKTWDGGIIGKWELSCFIGVKVDQANSDTWYAVPMMKPNLDTKGEIGKTKAPMWLLPSVALTETAWAMDDGSKKYGSYNWRETKVCASTYISAMMRHWAAYLDGEDRATDSGCHHLAHIVANCNILMDAAKCGTLVDDRPKLP